jgi:hypothetical protein
VIDGGRIQWFEGFTPGAGAQREDGSAVTLLQFVAQSSKSGKPAIRIGVESGDTQIERWVDAGDTQDPDVRLEMSPLRDEAIVVMAHRAGRAEVFHVRAGAVANVQVLTDGESWRIPGIDVDLRLEQFLPQAAPVVRENSPLLEVVLIGPGGGRLRVRQGESIRVAETTLRFVRNTDVD